MAAREKPAPKSEVITGLVANDATDTNPDDPYKEIELITQALEGTSDGHPDLPKHLLDLALAHNKQFLHSGDTTSLDKAIDFNLRAHALTLDTHPDRLDQLHGLVSSYHQRFLRLGELADLDKAIEYTFQAQSLTPQSHPNFLVHLNELSGFHSERFYVSGDLTDIDKSIELVLEAVSRIPGPHPDRAPLLSQVGSSYQARYDRLSHLDDLDKAIEYGIEAVALTPENDPSLASRLTTFSKAYHARFMRLGEVEDLDQAIKHRAKACALTPEGHPDLALRLSMLGVSYHERYMHLEELADLDTAIEYKLKAHALTPEGHPQQRSRLSNLGAAYHERYLCHKNLEDIDKSIEYNVQACEVTPAGHPELPIQFGNLARAYGLKYLNVGDETLLHRAADYLIQAATSVGGHPRERLGAALEWAALASANKVPEKYNRLHAYKLALELIPDVIWLGATVDQRYAALEQFSDVAIQAASAAIADSRYDLALDWLEQGRSIIWNQILSLRSPLNQLDTIDSSMAAELQTIRDELQILSAPSSERTSSSESDVRRQHQLATQYTELMARVRQLPGFETYLLPRPTTELSFVARTGPVVILSLYRSQCDALVLQPDNPTINHVPLRNFTQKKAYSVRTQMELSLGRGGERAERRPIPSNPEPHQDFAMVLGTLWDDIVKPVLDFLGLCDTFLPEEKLPHITWCTTGSLAFLPLHAAGHYDRPNSKLSDYAVSSYTPTLGSLLDSSIAPETHSSILVVGQESTGGMSNLPGTAQELAYIQKHTKSSHVTQLTGPAATPSAVLDEMEKHDWVHLACHAHQNITDPRKSGFFLHGGILDLSHITRRSFKKKGLAFLSACQTAMGDRKLADEAVHLASGMLIAGYRGVVATMWAVGDSDAPFVADRVYSRVFRGGKMDGRGAARALHHAVAELRNEIGEDKFECWAPFVHIGS